MGTSLKEMDNSLRGQRVRGLMGDTANAWHVILNGFIVIIKKLLSMGMTYVLPGKFQSDGIEGEFGVIRQQSGGQQSGGQQVVSSLTLRRLKLYHKLNLDDPSFLDKSECCGSLQDKDEDLELLDKCFDESCELSEAEMSTLYYISGYVALKEDITCDTEISADDIETSEFTELVSRGKLRHPPHASQYIYTFFKTRPNKCCTKIFFRGLSVYI